MKKLFFGMLVLAVAGIGLFQVFGNRLLSHAMLHIATDRMSGATLSSLEDGLHVVLCGAGSPLPDPRRSGPCVLVIAGQRVFVVDTGSGAAANIGLMGIPLGRIERVFITHFHSDHIDGLGEVSLLNWAGGGRQAPLPVHGPDGIETVIAGFNLAYRHDFGYRVAHHGEAIIPPGGAGSLALPFAPPAEGQQLTVLEQDGVVVRAFRVEHPPIEPAVGYRFEYRGRSVIISGDTAKSANLQKFASGADLLVHEALAPDMVRIMRRAAEQAGQARLATIMDDILDYHTSPVEAAEIARDAAVGHLLYYHVVPALPFPPFERLFLAGVRETWDGALTVGRDGSWVGLPADSGEILTGNLLPF